MKVKLQPLYLEGLNEREQNEFQEQLKILCQIYKNEAEFLAPVSVEKDTEEEIDAVVFPQLTGAVFKSKEYIRRIKKPIIILTSQFGTVEMWDWEIIAYFKGQLGLKVFSPYEVELGKTIMRTLAARREMQMGVKFLMFQDSPGEGMQANIFKKFYWWEKECVDNIKEEFGVEVVYKSYKELNEIAEQIEDKEAEQLWMERAEPMEGVLLPNILKSVKLYIAIRNIVQQEKVQGVGGNCLNESFLSSTTPCLAWNWIFEYDKLLWACEGDLLSLISKYIFYHALKKPLMMTNIYPFLVGMAALKHEKIQEFPQINNSENYALGVHCGYFGFAPRSFCKEWIIRPKVLEIVNGDAIVVDCKMEVGEICLAKLCANLKKITIIEAEIERYVQYPGSDCRNGALIHYKNNKGHLVMDELSSHHAIIIQGYVTPYLMNVAQIFGFEVTVI